MTTLSENGQAIPLPAGDYGIVELFGHVTLVGRISEVEKFGVKMLAIEPLYNDELLPAVFHGGAAIYRLTPCNVEDARRNQPRKEWQLPPVIRSILPAALLAATSGGDNPADDDDDRNELPF